MIDLSWAMCCKSSMAVGEDVDLLSNFCLLFLSSKMTKSQNPYICRGGGGIVDLHSTFVPEFKNSKTQTSLCPMGRGWLLIYFSTFVPKFKNEKIPIPYVWVGVGGWCC